MVKFFSGLAIGALAVYFTLVYPQQTRKVVQTGIDTATTAIAQGTAAASKMADQQLAKAGK